MKKKIFPIVITLLLVVVIVILISKVLNSAQTPNLENQKDEFVGRNAERPSVICLSPAFVEMLYYIKRENHIVAVTEGCDFPVQAQNLPNLGSSVNLDYKKIEKLNFDKVFLYPSNMKEYAYFKTHNKDVLLGKVDSLSSISETMWSVGQIFKEEDAVVQWIEDLDKSIVELKKKIVSREARGEEPPKILFVLKHNSEFSNKIHVAGSKLFYNDVIEKAGGVNAYQGATDVGEITFEQLSALKPDIIIDIAIPDNSTNFSEIKSGWEKKLAEKLPNQSVKVEVFLDTWARRPGPRVIELINNVGKIVFE